MAARINLWDCWMDDPSIFEYALKHQPEVVDRWIARDPTYFEQFLEAHPHVRYSEELQAARVAAWDKVPCGSVVHTSGKLSRNGGNMVTDSILEAAKKLMEGGG